jgi:predicted PurR-regulated permease PerM
MDIHSSRRHVRQPNGSADATATAVEPVASVGQLWKVLTRVAIMGIFVILFGAVLRDTRAVLGPVVAAIIIGSMIGPLIEKITKRGAPPFLAALVIVGALFLFFYGVVSAFSTPISAWVSRAPEIGTLLKERFQALREPLNVLQSIQEAIGTIGGAKPSAIAVDVNNGTMISSVLTIATPALAQFVLFIGTLLFFLAGRAQMKRKLVVGFMNRDARLLVLRIISDIERALGRYLATVTIINLGVGTVTAALMWLAGLPNPAMWGLLAFVLNYIPYVGPAIMTAILLGVGMVSFPTIGLSLLPAGLFVVLTTIEGHFIAPNVIGKRLTLNPFVVFLALAFWTWIWGAIGTFMAVPILVVGVVIIDHLFPKDEISLPG